MDPKKLEELAKLLAGQIQAGGLNGMTEAAEKTKSGRTIPTVQSTLEAAFNCKTKEEAEKLFTETCDILAEASDSTPFKYEELIRFTIGKEAVGRGPEESQRMYELFGATHPVFGPPEKYWSMTLLDMWKRNKEWEIEQKKLAIEKEEKKKKNLADINAKLDRIKQGLSAQVTNEEDAA